LRYGKSSTISFAIVWMTKTNPIYRVLVVVGLKQVSVAIHRDLQALVAGKATPRSAVS